MRQSIIYNVVYHLIACERHDVKYKRTRLNFFNCSLSKSRWYSKVYGGRVNLIVNQFIIYLEIFSCLNLFLLVLMKLNHVTLSSVLQYNIFNVITIFEKSCYGVQLQCDCCWNRHESAILAKIDVRSRIPKLCWAKVLFAFGSVF